jgi:ATP-binding cassette subfamily F protein uup
MTLDVLEEALLSFPGCALIVSHDRWLLDRVATAILAFEGDGRVTRYEGNYSTYAELRPKAALPKGRVPAAPRGRQSRGETGVAGPRKLTYKERQELGGIEAAILAAEERVGSLEALLNDSAVYKERGAEIPTLVAELGAARAEVERLYERWQELEAIGR